MLGRLVGGVLDIEKTLQMSNTTNTSHNGDGGSRGEWAVDGALLAFRGTYERFLS